jgi:hypothetical protein
MNLINQIQKPDITDVNSLLTYLLGLLVFVVGFLYVEKKRELNDLKAEHKKELNELKAQVNRLYDDNITDLKEFDKDKTKTIIDIQSMMNKLYMLLDQIKTLINDKR